MFPLIRQQETLVLEEDLPCPFPRLRYKEQAAGAEKDEHNLLLSRIPASMELLHCSCTGPGWPCSCASRAGESHHELAHPALNCILLPLLYLQTHKPHTVVFDLSDTKTVVNAAEEILKALGHVDILINNAGISFRGTIVDTGLDVDKKVMETNYFGPIALTKGTTWIWLMPLQTSTTEHSLTCVCNCTWYSAG